MGRQMEKIIEKILEIKGNTGAFSCKIRQVKKNLRIFRVKKKHTEMVGGAGRRDRPRRRGGRDNRMRRKSIVKRLMQWSKTRKHIENTGGCRS